MASRKRRHRVSMPRLLFWNVRDQARFIEGIERFQSLTNDLANLVGQFSAAAARVRQKPRKPRPPAEPVNGQAVLGKEVSHD